MASVPRLLPRPVASSLLWVRKSPAHIDPFPTSTAAQRTASAGPLMAPMRSVDRSRLLSRIRELAAIGREPDGGIIRLAWSREDRFGIRSIRHRSLLVTVPAATLLSVMDACWAVPPAPHLPDD